MTNWMDQNFLNDISSPLADRSETSPVPGAPTTRSPLKVPDTAELFRIQKNLLKALRELEGDKRDIDPDVVDRHVRFAYKAIVRYLKEHVEGRR